MSVSAVLNRWLKHLYKLLAILLVIFAVSISALRLFLPYAHNYSQNVEDYINTRYNSNISIGSLSMGWRESGPTLITQQVELLSRHDSKIYIGSLEVELDFWRSIRSGQLVTTDFVISGAKLEFEQAALVNSTENITANESDNNDLIDSLSTILLEQISRFSIRDSHVLYRSIAGVRAFTINEMFWLNDQERHRANGTVIVDGLSSNNLKVLLDFQGQKFDDFNGQAYLEANEIDITPWLGRVLAIEDANTHSAINFNAWLNINAGKPEFIQLALGQNEITWQHHDKNQTFEIIGGDVQINILDEVLFDVATSPLTIKRNGIETNKISLLANVNGSNINGYISGLELASFTDVSPLLFDDVPLEKLLLDLDAVGRVEDIHFRTSADDVAVSAKLIDVDSHFSHGIPGIDNVSGELLYANNQLQITLDAIDGELNFGKHFKKPIPYTHLSGQLNAQFLGDNWQLRVNDIDFDSPALALTADVKVNSEKDKAVTLALLASVSHGDAKYAELYYPHLLMGENLYSYLDDAIIDGTLNQALVLFNGPLESFPFNHNEGVFVVDAELTKSTFIFDPEWPVIEGFSANLNFTNNSMLITGREGTLSGIDVTGVEAAINSLSDEQILTVDADFKQVQPKLVSVLMDASPLQDSIGKTLEQVQVSEPIDGDFSLILPLNDLDAVVAKGHVDFKNNNVVLKTPSMVFNNVNGRLDYYNDVIKVDGVELGWQGLPLTLNVEAKQKSDHYNVSIETLAQWQGEQWQSKLPEELVKYAQGQANWQGLLSLNISDDKFSYDYQINSTLDELTLSLPTPFSKTAGEKVAMSVHAFGDESASTINADIGNKIGFYGLLDHEKTYFSSAHLVLGQPQSWLPTTGFHITADVEQANYAQWQPLVLDIMAALNAEPNDLNDSIEPSDENMAQYSLLSAPEKIQGKVNNLDVYGEHFQQVSFDFSPEPHWWLLNINAKELRGAVKFYPDWYQQGVDLDIDFMHLKNNASQLTRRANDTVVDETAPELEIKESSSTPQVNLNALSEIKNKSEEQTNPDDSSENSILASQIPILIDHANNMEIFSDIPPLSVKCGSCQYGVYDFGEVAFTLEREGKNILTLHNFSAKRDKTKLLLDGKWQQDENNSQTTIKGSLLTDNVAAEVENLGYVSIIKDSGVEINYDVVWQGGPHNFAMATFDGDLTAKFDDGYLADVDDKGVRILSLLSLQSLVRKLSFDFRDIFSDGMFYQELGGEFIVKSGVAYTDNVLMKGTAGDLTIIGNTNFNTGDLDYRMSYKPNLTSSLPVLAWIATLNPVTFLAGMALDEVITSSVIAEINFEVTGNLDDPQFKQVSRKNKNISVGRSSPPQIVENSPDESSAITTDETEIKPSVKDDIEIEIDG